MIGFETTYKSKVLDFRKLINVEQEIKRIIDWMLSVTKFELVDFKLNVKNVLLTDGLTVIYEGKYTLRNPKTDTLHKFTFLVPKFINEYYMLINSMRYAFIFSFVDKALTRFGSKSNDAKLSNLYVRADIRNIFSDAPLQYWAKNYNNHLLNFIFAYYYIEKNIQNYNDLIQYVLDKFNVDYEYIETLPDNITAILKQKNKYNKYLVFTMYDEENNTVYFINKVDNINYKITNIIDKWQLRLLTEFKPIKTSQMEVALLNKKTLKQGKKVIVFFKTLFDLFTMEMLEIKTIDEFVEKYLIQGYIAERIKDMAQFTNIKTKRVMIKLFFLHPFIRQIMKIIYDYYYDGGETLVKKHSITLAIFHKILQIELAEGKINNPISEVALNSKISYINKFALRRNSQSVRLINNLSGVLDVVATPETKKVGSVNWLVFGYDGDIE